MSNNNSPAAPHQEPEWWIRAKALESENRLKEAEALLKASIDHLGFAIQTAQLYAERFERLRDAGELQGARDAHAQAVDWAYNYASYATSGGEGAALSYERDKFIKELGPAPQG